MSPFFLQSKCVRKGETEKHKLFWHKFRLITLPALDHSKPRVMQTSLCCMKWLSCYGSCLAQIRTAPGGLSLLGCPSDCGKGLQFTHLLPKAGYWVRLLCTLLCRVSY